MAEAYVFIFFVLGFTGWVLETVHETIVKKKFINKGFFKSPFVLSPAIGGMAIYLICSLFKQHTALVFCLGILVATFVEYATALFLEKCFNVKCWDYTTYLHTKWCTYKGRICLTVSLYFGILALFIVYFYWDFLMGIVDFLRPYVLIINIIFIAAFVLDAFFSCARVIKARRAGVELTGDAVFSDTGLGR
jgi:uncharacterized membrane protein